MKYQPGEVVEMSDRTYIADKYGSLRVLEYATENAKADLIRAIVENEKQA